MTLTITHHPEDGHEDHGRVTLTAHDAGDRAFLSGCYDLHLPKYGNPTAEQAVAYAEFITSDTAYTHERRSDKRPWFYFESALDHDFFKPYLDHLQWTTGYDGPGPTSLQIPLTDSQRCCPTRLLDTLYIECGHLCYRLMVQAEPWNDMDAATYAEKLSISLIAGNVGREWRAAEFCHSANGQEVRNPDYNRHPRASTPFGPLWGAGSVTPSWNGPVSSTGSLVATVWATLFDWWRDYRANDRQLAVLAGHDEAEALQGAHASLAYASKYVDQRGLTDSNIIYLDEGGSIKWHDRTASSMDWTEFAAL